MTKSAGGGSRSPRHLLIISRYHPGLYDYLRARFAGEGNIQVILDRRSGRDRRTAVVEADSERRSGQRRIRPHIDAKLRMESMQFVTVLPHEAPAEPPPAEPTSDRSP